MEFNPFMIRNVTVSKQHSTVNNNFKATNLTYFSFSERIENIPWDPS